MILLFADMTIQDAALLLLTITVLAGATRRTGTRTDIVFPWFRVVFNRRPPRATRPANKPVTKRPVRNSKANPS